MKEGNDTSGEQPPGDYKDLLGVNHPKDTYIQIALSIILGVAAFFTFCVRSISVPFGFVDQF